MRWTVDHGRGSDLGRFVSLHIGPGRGYLRPWWTTRNAGPGAAIRPGSDCGHSWPAHCHSAHCRSWWCRLPSLSVVGPLLFCGHTLRVWLGPTYRWTSPRAWIERARIIRRRQRMQPHSDVYAFVSFV